MAKKDKTEPRGTVATIPVWCRFDEAMDIDAVILERMITAFPEIDIRKG